MKEPFLARKSRPPTIQTSSPSSMYQVSSSNVCTWLGNPCPGNMTFSKSAYDPPVSLPNAFNVTSKPSAHKVIPSPGHHQTPDHSKWRRSKTKKTSDKMYEMYVCIPSHVHNACFLSLFFEHASKPSFPHRKFSNYMSETMGVKSSLSPSHAFCKTFLFFPEPCLHSFSEKATKTRRRV